MITQVGPSWRGSGFSALHFPTFELAGFPISRHQVSVMGATLDHRIIASYGLIAPLVTMSCRLLLPRVASPGVLPRERFRSLGRVEMWRGGVR